MHDADLGRALLILARSAIGRELGFEILEATAHEMLEAPGATFVTLKQGGELRGCIGTLEPVRALRRDVETNAVHAAFSDPRFAPLRRAEFDVTDIEVSLLGQCTPIECTCEDDLVAQLRPHHDGVVVRHGRRRGTFLPQVWEAVPEPRDFVRELKRKAGLPHDFWSRELVFERYSVAKWSERSEPLGAAAD